MILTARWVVPVVGTTLRDGYVRVEADEIVEIGPKAALQKSAAVTNLGEAILIPGLVNAHTHLELGCYSGKIKPAPLWPWLEDLIELRRTPGQLERERQAVIDGAWQSLRAGVTCVGDISRRNVSARALKSIPIRKVCYVELLTLADHPPRNPQELLEAVHEVEEDELLTAGISPHAPYTVPRDQIRAAFELAEEFDRPWTIHLAETREEIRFLRGERGVLPEVLEKLIEQCGVRTTDETPIGLLLGCSRGLRSGSLAHVNYVDDAEIASLAEQNHVVVYCPRAHRFYGHELHPFRRLQAAGMTVALGTDSPASVDSMSMLDELHHVHTQVADAPAPHELLRMATLDAARALRLDAKIGSLEPGKQADIAAFACPADETDPLRHLIEHPAPPVGVWVAGRAISDLERKEANA